MKNYFEMVASEATIIKATSENLIELFDLNNTLIKSVHSIYDSGGKRLDFSEKLGIVIAGNFYDGVQAIDVESNKIIWYNRKIKHIQKIYISSNNKSVYLLTEAKKFIVLDILNGEIQSEISNIKNLFFSKNQNIVFLKGTKLYLYEDDKLTYLYEGDGVFLNIFSNSNVSIISEAYKNLVLIENNSKKKLWSSDLPPGFAVHSIIKTSESSLFTFAKYSTPSGLENYLIKINFTSGKVENKTKLSSEIICYCFSPDGKTLFSSNDEKIQL